MAPRGITYHLVDVFTAEAFQGNPAAVVTDADCLSEEVMARMAAEINLSETAFVLSGPPQTDADVRIRWFTPTCEVNMCGHATIAAVHVLAQSGQLPAGRGTPDQPILIDTKGGVLQAHRELPAGPSSPEKGAIIWLDLVRPQLRAEPIQVGVLAGLLGTSADAFVDNPQPVRTQDNDLIVFVRDILRLNELQPAFGELATWSKTHGVRGVCVSTTSTLVPAITVQSRFFAPAFGIDEDPVTGSVHGPLAAHLVAGGVVRTFDNLAALTCIQATPTGRAGLIRVLVQRQADNGYEVRIGGSCVTVASGVFFPRGRRTPQSAS